MFTLDPLRKPFQTFKRIQTMGIGGNFHVSGIIEKYKLECMDRLKPRTIRLIGRLHAWLWKLTGGKLGNAFGRAPFMMLTTRGRKTGRERTTPVLYHQHGADLIVVASFGGNDMHPAWYLNLERCPEAEVMINGERRQLLAHRVSPEEKEHIWRRLIKLYPNFAIYQRRTRREIPLLRLSDCERIR